MNTQKQTVQTPPTELQEGAKVLALLRALGSEEQRIAFALMEGMRIQRNMDAQERVDTA